MSSTKIYFFLIIILYSCQTENKTEKSSIKKSKSEAVTIPKKIKEVKIENGLPPELNKIIHYFDSLGMNTDSTRIKLLAKYAYPNLRIGKFKFENGLYYVPLDKNKISKLITGWKFDFEIYNCLGNGKGFFFTSLDSTGKAILESADRAVEFWEINDSCNIKIDDLKFNFNRIANMGTPLPVVGIRIKEGIIILSARSSYEEDKLKDCLKYISK